MLVTGDGLRRFLGMVGLVLIAVVAGYFSYRATTFAIDKYSAWKSSRANSAHGRRPGHRKQRRRDSPLVTTEPEPSEPEVAEPKVVPGPCRRRPCCRSSTVIPVLPAWCGSRQRERVSTGE